MKLASGEISTLNQVGVSVPRAPRVAELHGTDRLPGLPEPQLLSADGRYVMIGKLTGDDRKPEEKYTLTVYDRATAKPIPLPPPVTRHTFPASFSIKPLS